MALKKTTRPFTGTKTRKSFNRIFKKFFNYDIIRLSKIRKDDDFPFKIFNFSCLWIFFGFNFNEPTLFRAYATWISWFLCTGFNFFQIVIFANKLCSKFYILDMVILGNCLFNVIFCFSFPSKSKKVEKLFKNLNALVTDEVIQESRKVNLFFVFTFALFGILDCSGLFGYILRKGPMSYLNLFYSMELESEQWYHYIISLIDSFSYSLFVSIYPRVIITLYTVFVYFFGCIHVSVIKNFGTVKTFPSEERQLAYLKLFRVTRRNLMNLRSELFGHLSLFPFIWFSALFFGATVRLIMGSESDYSTIKFEELAEWINFGTGLTTSLLSVLVVDYITHKEKSVTRTFLSSLTTSAEESTAVKTEKLLLRMEVQNFPILKATAWTFFKLDREMILSFLGAVVTFAVMFKGLVSIR